MEDSIKEKHIRKAYTEAGSLQGGFKPHTNLCKGTNDEILSTEKYIKNKWQTYFQDLLNATTVERNISPDNTYTNDTETEQQLDNDPPHILDIDPAIQSLRNNKTSGIDNIPIKLNKKGGQLLINILHSLIKRIWVVAKVPVQ